MRLANLFVRTAILDGLVPGKAELVGRLLTLLAQEGHLPPAQVPKILNAVLRREQLGSTGVGGGVAIPHAKHPAVTRPLGILAVCRKPVEFDALDGEPADIIALCLFPVGRPEQHLGEASRGSERLLRGLADEGFCRRLRQAESAEEIEEIVQAEDGMTRREWAACKDPAAMLLLLQDQGLHTERKARLFGCACCRRLVGLLPEEGRRAIEVVERYVDGLASREEVDAARRAFTAGSGNPERAFPTYLAMTYLMSKSRHDPARWISRGAAQAAGDQAAELAAQADIIRCLFGSPPFRLAIRQEWLSFGDGTVTKMARGIYEERAFDRMPILADALLDAGCGDEILLGHLRGPGQHWRGCWVLDLLVGKQ